MAMAGASYSDLELAHNIQQFYLQVAGYIISIEFLEAEQIWFKRLLIEDFKTLWKNLILETKTSPKVTILIDFSAMQVMTSTVGGDKFYLGLEWDGKSKTAVLKGLLNVWVLQTSLRHIIMNLIKDEGFVFHGSVVKDPRDKVYVFSAKSGGGKSTTARALEAKGWKILSDDTVVFLKGSKKWSCYSLGMIEKQFLPVNFQSSNFRVYFVEKDKALSKIKLKKDVSLLERVVKQVWMIDRTIDEKTYKNVMDFAKENEFYELRLPLNPKNMEEFINAN